MRRGHFYNREADEEDIKSERLSEEQCNSTDDKLKIKVHGYPFVERFLSKIWPKED